MSAVRFYLTTVPLLVHEYFEGNTVSHSLAELQA